eukprot:PhM_4_TR2879/c0_g2_i1/m.888
MILLSSAVLRRIQCMLGKFDYPPLKTRRTALFFHKEQVFVFPTVEQEVYSLTSLVRGDDRPSVITTVVYLFVRASSSIPFGIEYYDGLFRAGLRSHGVAVVPRLITQHFSNTAGLIAAMPKSSPSALVFVIGLGPGEPILKQIAEHIANNNVNNNLMVGVLFSEMALLWHDIWNCTRTSLCGQGLSRIRVTSNMPLWTLANTSVFSKLYQGAVASSDPAIRRHPLTVMGFVVAQVSAFLLSKTAVLSGAAWIDALYKYTIVSIGDLVLGPFDQPGKCNVGPRTLFHYSLGTILFDTTDIAVDQVGFSSCDVEFEPEPSESQGVDIGLVIGVSIAGVVVVATIATGINRRKAQKRNWYAPREPPMCFLLTDIQSSTKLWEAFPESMPAAVETHHRVIRHLIAEYNAYEVKTVGDAFMIAIKSTLDGTLLAMDIQQGLFEAEWPEGLDVDRVYGGSDANPDVWSGLRVRIGVHRAVEVGVKYDAVHSRYDYYGHDVMILNKVESSADGGQVLMTSQTFQHLCEHRDYAGIVEPTIASRVAMRDAYIEGVADPMTMYALYPLDLAARKLKTGEQSPEVGETASSLASSSGRGPGRALRIFFDAMPANISNRLLALFFEELKKDKSLSMAVPSETASTKRKRNFILSTLREKVLVTAIKPNNEQQQIGNSSNNIQRRTSFTEIKMSRRRSLPEQQQNEEEQKEKEKGTPILALEEKERNAPESKYTVL